jgi:putative acetyltransferase
MTANCVFVKWEPDMKIQKLTEENHAKVYALLRRAFPRSAYEAELVQGFHENGKPVHEWVCIHANKVIAYIAFSNAYHGNDICGLHLAPMAVTPEFQKQGVGSELLRYALRQEPIKSRPLFVLGEPGFYKKFGFEPCSLPICPFDKNNAHFLSLRNNPVTSFTVGYEPEFKTAAKAPKSQDKKRR